MSPTLLCFWSYLYFLYEMIFFQIIFGTFWNFQKNENYFENYFLTPSYAQNLHDQFYCACYVFGKIIIIFSLFDLLTCSILTGQPGLTKKISFTICYFRYKIMIRLGYVTLLQILNYDAPGLAWPNKFYICFFIWYFSFSFQEKI